MKSTKSKIMKEELYGWIFTYNPHTKNWRTCQRDELNDFFSKSEENFLRSKSIDTLIELILKNKGNNEAIKQLINKKL